jgi:hypothetical protein
LTDRTETTKDTNAERFEDPQDAKPWHDMLEGADKVFQPWNDCCDNIDRQYASLERLRGMAEDREFQIFWANMETLLPAIYARPPQPVVVPRFKDRKELPRTASEVLERCLIANGDLDNAHRQYIQVRNDLARAARGVAWTRYDVRGGMYEYACVEHLNRRDFRHEPARSWPEVQWVARRSFLTKDKGLARFGKEFLKATFSNTKTDTPEAYTYDRKAEVWEIWHKGLGVVCWVTPGYDKVLEISEPHVTFDGFFPCPEPAYSTREPDSLIPVPDFLYYKDQIEEINILTARITALANRLKMKGFYASGAEDLSTAIEKAWADTGEGAMLVGVPNMAAMGQSVKDSIVWMPVREVAETIMVLVTLRKQLIEDVYQITGISDIMRGTTAASETLGAQQLKSQYGSVRVRERQAEMIRLCRDCTGLQAEIIAEHFQPDTIASMTQTDLPRMADIQQQLEQLKQQAMQMGPEEQQQAIQQAEQIAKQITLEQIVELFRDQRLRPFILDIETDSTIQPDEDGEKQRRAEFVQVLSALIAQALPLLQAAPEAADFIGEVLQFGTAPFRAGRQLEGAIDDLVEKIKQKAQQPPPPNPEAEKIKAELEDKKAEREFKAQDRQAEGQRKMQEGEIARQREMEDRAARAEEARMKAAEADRKAQHDTLMKSLDLKLKWVDLEIEKAKIFASAEQAREQRAEKQMKAEADEAKEFERGERDGQKSRQTEQQSAKQNEAVQSALQSVTEGQSAIAEALATLSEAMSRPKTIKFNEQGRPVGIQ